MVDGVPQDVGRAQALFQRSSKVVQMRNAILIDCRCMVELMGNSASIQKMFKRTLAGNSASIQKMFKLASSGQDALQCQAALAKMRWTATCAIISFQPAS